MCTEVIHLCPVTYRKFTTKMNLQGEHVVSIDPKGRIRLPAALLRQLGGVAADNGDLPSIPFVMNHWFENRLMLWPLASWNEMTKVLSKLNVFNPKHRNLQRMFMSGHLPISTDGAGRILINKRFLDYAKIEGELVMSCQFNRIEISPISILDVPLDAEAYQNLASEVFGGTNDAVVTDNNEIDLGSVFNQDDESDLDLLGNLLQS
jgi:MraZ protein